MKPKEEKTEQTVIEFSIPAELYDGTKHGRIAILSEDAKRTVLDTIRQVFKMTGYTIFATVNTVENYTFTR